MNKKERIGLDKSEKRVLKREKKETGVEEMALALTEGIKLQQQNMGALALDANEVVILSAGLCIMKAVLDVDTEKVAKLMATASMIGESNRRKLTELHDKFHNIVEKIEEIDQKKSGGFGFKM